mmetsp:Transcript_16955/g.52296  ORF Transcript_16955/g.52296 Transcript_16955/m.52296 type:complete len:200 (-) Transcript_16955:94-693(-)
MTLIKSSLSSSERDRHALSLIVGAIVNETSRHMYVHNNDHFTVQCISSRVTGGAAPDSSSAGDAAAVEVAVPQGLARFLGVSLARSKTVALLVLLSLTAEGFEACVVATLLEKMLMHGAHSLSLWPALRGTRFLHARSIAAMTQWAPAKARIKQMSDSMRAGSRPRRSRKRFAASGKGFTPGADTMTTLSLSSVASMAS